MATIVRFLIERDSDNDVFAYFPFEIFDNEGNGTCYAHIGQHSCCSDEYANECKEAQYSQFYPLLKELISIGYKDLEILNDQAIEYSRKPTKGEIKFGEGATHYREFPINAVLSRKGEIKKWFKADDDNLRYNRY